MAAQSASTASHCNLIYSWGIAAPTKGQVSTPTTLHQQADTPVYNTPSHRITRESLYSRGIPSHAHTARTQNSACDGKPSQFFDNVWWRHQASNIICIFMSVFVCFVFFSSCLQSHCKPFFPPQTYQVKQLDSWKSSLFYCLIDSTETETLRETVSSFPLRCLFKSLCLSHPSQPTLNQSNQIKNPQGPPCSRTGECPHPFLSRRDGYRLRAIKAFVGLLRWKSLCSYSYNGKELEHGTCTLLKVFVSAAGGVADKSQGGDIRFVCLKHQRMKGRENLGVARCEKRRELCVFLEHAPTHTHLTGAHLPGYCVQCPTNGTFKVTVSDMQIKRSVKVQFGERNQLFFFLSCRLWGIKTMSVCRESQVHLLVSLQWQLQRPSPFAETAVVQVSDVHGTRYKTLCDSSNSVATGS